LCIDYGADKKLFADVIGKDFLPKRRAEVREREYEDLAFAMTKLIGPHIDKRLANKFHEIWTRTIAARRARFTSQQHNAWLSLKYGDAGSAPALPLTGAWRPVAKRLYVLKDARTSVCAMSGLP
jgi:hypothetical protein